MVISAEVLLLAGGTPRLLEATVDMSTPNKLPPLQGLPVPAPRQGSPVAGPRPLLPGPAAGTRRNPRQRHFNGAAAGADPLLPVGRTAEQVFQQLDEDGNGSLGLGELERALLDPATRRLAAELLKTHRTALTLPGAAAGIDYYEFEGVWGLVQKVEASFKPATSAPLPPDLAGPPPVAVEESQASQAAEVHDDVDAGSHR